MSNTDTALPASAARLFELAEQVTGFMPADEGRALYDTAIALPRRRRRRSRSAPTAASRRCCSARRRQQSGGVLYTVDHHHGSEEHQPGWEYHDTSLVDPVERTVRHTAVAPPYAGRRRTSTSTSSRWSASRSWWPAAGEHRCGCLFIDGGHTEEAAQRDFDGWAKWVDVGGALVIHDVFPDPDDGGQAPFHVYRARWTPVPSARCRRIGSMRVLERTSGTPGEPL